MLLSGRGESLKVALLAVASVFLFSGCAGYHRQSDAFVTGIRSGSLDAAIADLESKNTGADKSLLYYLEKGELLRQKGDYAASNAAWQGADRKIAEWEDLAKTDPAKLLGDLGSVVINDTTRRYDGRDYEKVLLNIRIAMNHLALGNWEAARVEIKKMHEREATISEFRAKELETASNSSKEKGLRVTSYREINGYPVETLDSPEANALRNSYESAFANYLAGFTYEALGESSLAAAGYRKAIEMRPNEPLLDLALGGVDARVANQRSQKDVDTLFIIEAGDAPSIMSRRIAIPLPIPKRNGVGIVLTAISWPVIPPQPFGMETSSLTIDGQTYPIIPMSSVDTMARRALADEMPAIIARSSVRAIIKGAAQAATQEATKNAGLAGALVNLAVTAASVVSENADERIWRTLPASFSIVRTNLKPGSHTVDFGKTSKTIMISGPYSVVVLRQTHQSAYLAQMPYIEPIGIADAEATKVEVAPPPEATRKSAGATKKTKAKVSTAEAVK